MAVKFDEKVLYSGAVVAIRNRSWYDGMFSEYAVCWDENKKEFAEVEFGYYDINGTNLAGGT